MIKDCCAKYVIPAVGCERETGSIVLQEKKPDADTIDHRKLGWCLGTMRVGLLRKVTDGTMEVEPFKGVPFITSSAAKRNEKQPLSLSVINSTPGGEIGCRKNVSRVTWSLCYGEKDSINLNVVSQSTIRLDGLRKRGALTHLSIKPLPLIPAPIHLIAPGCRSPR